MPYNLSKDSAPGWDKEFETIEDLRSELEKHVCKSCWTHSTLENDADLDLGIIYIDEYEKMSELDKIAALLWTPCGCEFTVDEALMKELGITTVFVGKEL